MSGFRVSGLGFRVWDRISGYVRYIQGMCRGISEVQVMFLCIYKGGVEGYPRYKSIQGMCRGISEVQSRYLEGHVGSHNTG